MVGATAIESHDGPALVNPKQGGALITFAHPAQGRSMMTFLFFAAFDN